MDSSAQVTVDQDAVCSVYCHQRQICRFTVQYYNRMRLHVTGLIALPLDDSSLQLFVHNMGAPRGRGQEATKPQILVGRPCPL